MQNYILIKVPADSSDYFINNVGCLRYTHNKGIQSSVVEPSVSGIYLEHDKHEIIGVSELDGQKLVIIEIISVTQIINDDLQNIFEDDNPEYIRDMDDDSFFNE